MNLSKLKRCPEDLVLFLFKSSFSFFKSSLELLLLNFKAASLFVKLMDGATTITKLIKKILDFISQVLVFTLDNVKLLSSFFQTSLDSEKVTVNISGFLVASINFSYKIIMFGFPFSNDLVKGFASLFSDDGSSMNPFVFQLEVFQLNFHPAFAFLSGSNLCIQPINGLFSLRKGSTQLCLAHF